MKDIKKIVLEKINEAKSLLQLQEIRIEYLSKKRISKRFNEENLKTR